MGKTLRISITLLVVAAAILSGRWVWDHYMYTPWTRDGRVRADVITITPDVSGWVTTLNVANNQQVNKGDVLFSIDDTRYRAVLAEDEARVAQQRYAWELAKHQYERRKRLTDRQAISEEDLETYRIHTDSAQASYQLALAQLHNSQIDLARTQVIAPESGTINNLDLHQGNYVSKGTPVLSLIKTGSLYVTGYFEETKLQQVHIGQRATLYLMGNATPLTGRVTSIAKGIANTNTNSNNQLLPQIQQTFNWVRLAQRIPVDIALDPLPEGIHLSAGMTVSIHLHDR